MNQKYLIITLLVLTILLIVSALTVTVERSAETPIIKSATTTTSTQSVAKSYTEKIIVTFTNKVYPTDSNQPNPRLRRYLGKVQNTGTETISSLTLKVEYLDVKDQPIKEQAIRLDETLKPNFIQEFTFGGLDVPEDWSGKMRYTISDFRFANERAYQYYAPASPNSILDRPPQEIILSPII